MHRPLVPYDLLVPDGRRPWAVAGEATAQGRSVGAVVVSGRPWWRGR